MKTTFQLGNNVKLLGDCYIGEDSIIEDNVTIGHPSVQEFSNFMNAFRKNKNTRMNEFVKNKTVIGKNSVIRSGTVIYSGVIIGDNFDCGHNVVIREYTKIGDNVYVMPGTIIGKHVKMGDNVKVHGVISDGCELEDDSIVLGSLIDDPYVGRGGPKIKISPLVKKGAIVGANSLVIGNVTVGTYSFVAAGSVVTTNVDDYQMVAGVPAKQIKSVWQIPNYRKEFRAPQYRKGRIAHEVYSRKC